MISVLAFMDGKKLEKALSDTKAKSASVKLGIVGERITKGIFKTNKEATTRSGKADIVGVPSKNVLSVIQAVEGKNSPTVASLNDLINDSMGVKSFDIEAKATGNLLGGTGFAGSRRGTLKVTGATASINPRGQIDTDYIERQRVLITELVELGMTSNKGKVSKINKLFEDLRIEVDDSYTSNDLKELQDEIFKVVGGSRGKSVIRNAYDKVMNDPKKFKQFMEGPFGSLITDKVTNLTAQINVKDTKSDNTLTFFQTFIGLKFTSKDIVRKKGSTGSYSFFLSSAFEKKLLEETKRKLEQNAIGVIEEDINKVFNISGKTTLNNILKRPGSLKEIIDSLTFDLNIKVPSGGSIALNFGITGTKLFDEINAKTARALSNNLVVSSKVRKGRFASAAQLTSLLQIEVLSRMRKSGRPKPPTLTNRSGRFVENLEIAQVNYKNSIINYYSMPLYYSLEEYGYDVENLIEGSIRDITQKLYSRQFNLIRA